MTLDWSLLSKIAGAIIPVASGLIGTIIPAASGLLGVYLGSTLTSRREEAREKAQSKKETSYLAILVVSHLDRLVNRCVDVVGDDGTSYGQPAGKNGAYHEATVETPSFDPLSLNVEWKVLPPDLLYRILSLPYSIEVLNQHISSIGEFDDPPDYSEYFWTRQHGYAELGLEVAQLAYELRAYASLPSAPGRKGDWNRDDYLKEQKENLEQAARRHKESQSVSQVVTSATGHDG